MVKAQRFVYVKRFVGEPKESDFQLEDEDLPVLKDGEVLVKALFLSVDPYMRKYMVRYPLGVTMIGGQVSEVLESKHPGFAVGAKIYGQFGWRTHTVFNPDNPSFLPIPPYVLPSFGKHPISLGLGCIGSNSAYFGLFEICQPKNGETVVVTGAAGAVGHLVGQMAKSIGCTVVGLAGDDAKCEWLRTLGFDHAINYKTADVSAALLAAAPDGYDCYFDNVGGALSSMIIRQMRVGGRIAVCGAISAYNLPEHEVPREPGLNLYFIIKELTMRGFLVGRWADRWTEGLTNVFKMVDEGKVKYRETVTEGFEQMPAAFIGMLRGENLGKAIVKTNL